MKLPKLFMFLFVLSMIASCSPEVLADSQAPGIDSPQATNDNTVIIDDGSKK